MDGVQEKEDLMERKRGRRGREGKTVRNPSKAQPDAATPQQQGRTSALTAPTADVRSRVAVEWHTGCASGTWAPMAPKITSTRFEVQMHRLRTRISVDDVLRTDLGIDERVGEGKREEGPDLHDKELNVVTSCEGKSS